MIHKQLLKEALINIASFHQQLITGWCIFKENYVFVKMNLQFDALRFKLN